jgi:hypothetical protein
MMMMVVIVIVVVVIVASSSSVLNTKIRSIADAADDDRCRRRCHRCILITRFFF